MDKCLFSSNTGEWETPQDFFDSLDKEFHFTLDPCSTDENAKCTKHYTKEQDGLNQDWTGDVVFCNPPYGREMTKWIEKCYEHFRMGGGWQLCLSQRGLTQKHFMNSYMGKHKFDLSGDGCVSEIANGMLRFRL